MSLGKIAYEAYGDSRSWETVGGIRMPAWEDQFDYLQEAWEAAAQAVVSAKDAENVPEAREKSNDNVQVDEGSSET